MATDEVSQKRAERTRARPKAARTGTNEVATRDMAPPERKPLFRWMAAQHAHTDAEMAGAAVHIRERWGLDIYTPWRKIERMLASENSPHLTGYHRLLNEYRTVYSIDPDDDEFLRETGVTGELIPTDRHRICSGTGCTRRATKGSDYCARHGGDLLTEDDRTHLSRTLHDRLLIAAETGVAVLLDIAVNGRNDKDRVAAVGLLLDKAGFESHLTVEHKGQIDLSVAANEAARALNGRLDRLSQGLTAIEEPQDAEIVDEADAG